MRHRLSALCTALSLSFAVPVTPALAVPFLPVPVQMGQSDVTNVQADQRIIRRKGRRDDRRDRFERRGSRAFYRGHPGYRYKRPGYRRYNGWWFPPAAFITGAIIGNTLSQPARSGNRHVQWCYERYRSYRASDNTFQPYEGPRRQCYSPYR